MTHRENPGHTCTCKLASSSWHLKNSSCPTVCHSCLLTMRWLRCMRMIHRTRAPSYTKGGWHVTQVVLSTMIVPQCATARPASHKQPAFRHSDVGSVGSGSVRGMPAREQSIMAVSDTSSYMCQCQHARAVAVTRRARSSRSMVCNSPKPRRELHRVPVNRHRS